MNVGKWLVISGIGCYWWAYLAWDSFRKASWRYSYQKRKNADLYSHHDFNHSECRRVASALAS